MGLIVDRGSISEFGYNTLPAAIWAAASSAVQPRNGLGPGEASTTGALAAAGPPNARTRIADVRIGRKRVKGRFTGSSFGAESLPGRSVAFHRPS